MSEWLRNRWRAIVGGLVLVWQVTEAALQLAEHYDFIQEHVRKPGWIGDVIEYLFHPPAWVTLPSIGLGFALLFLDSKRQKRDSQPGPAATKRNSSAIANDWPRLTDANLYTMSSI